MALTNMAARAWVTSCSSMFAPGCGEVNINRIAADDCSDQILALFARSLTLGDADKDRITRAGIRLLQTGDSALLHTALFGIAR